MLTYIRISISVKLGELPRAGPIKGAFCPGAISGGDSHRVIALGSLFRSVEALDRASFSQVCDFGGAVAQTAKNLVGMLAEAGRRRGRRGIGARQLEACARHADAAIHAWNVVEILQQIAMRHLGILEGLGHRDDAPGRDSDAD